MRLLRGTILVCAALVATGATALALRTSPLHAQQQPQSVTVRGRVVDDAGGAPVAAAAVTLTTRDRASRASETTLAETTADGRFSFTVPARPASAALLVQAAGYLPGYLGQLGAQDIAAARVTVDVLGVDGRDLEVRLTREGVISGTVRDRDGQPVVRADIVALAKTYTAVAERAQRRSRPVSRRPVAAGRLHRGDSPADARCASDVRAVFPERDGRQRRAASRRR
jgi:hypothetical protein